MVGALWFLIRLTALVALVMWTAALPGTIRLEWADYTLTMKVGYFLMVAAAAILLAIFIYNVIRTFVELPASYKRYREIRRREKGYRALTLGLTAVAAGDTRVAAKQAERAGKFLPNDNGLPLLLRAQAARMQGDEEEALQSFAALLENEDAAFLGVRGLLQAALDHKNHAKALDFARQALKIHPKQGWILKLVYDLEIRERKWDDALNTLEQAQKIKAFAPERILSDRTALLLAKADDQTAMGDRDGTLKTLKAAVHAGQGFAPAAIDLAEFYLNEDKRSKAVSVIEKAWKQEPHPALAAFWSKMVPLKNARDPLARMRWFEKLYKLNKGDARANIEAGHMAMKEGLWGEARSYLKRAEEKEPTAEIYVMLADLERFSGHGEEAAQGWLAKAETAAPAPTWICRETGRVYKDWTPLAAPHGSFNTIEWRAPDAAALKPAPFEAFMAEAMIEAPR